MLTHKTSGFRNKPAIREQKSKLKNYNININDFFAGV
uniref:Uncharacterized protein n=1 Tax=Arundo donax TaxID=35708 RepID=A0A0A9F6A6_ARUDO